MDNNVNHRRKELLEKLNEIKFSAYLTYLSSEGALEIEVFTSKGYSFAWAGVDDWYLYSVRYPKKSLWDTILGRVNNSFTISDLEDSDFVQLIETLCSDSNKKIEELPSSFKYFDSLEYLENGVFYCYYDANDGIIYFSNSKEEMKNILALIYPIQTEWDALSNEELLSYIEIYESRGDYFPTF